ncbi:MAG: hypothetical protein AB1608_10200 [Thermoproteota archaeon]
MVAHSKTSILFNKIDVALGRKIYGNTTGLLNNIRNRSKYLTNIDESTKKTNPGLYSLVKYGFTKYPISYDDSLIKIIQKKIQSLIEDDKYSVPTSGYKGKIYGRAIVEPYKHIPELSKLITDDILTLLRKYYTSPYTIVHILIRRNYFVPLEIRTKHEMFSNFWHNDRDAPGQIKYFVYMTDVTEKDGPFHIQTKERTRELIKMGFGSRFDYKLSQDVLEDPKHVTKILGPAGTSFFGDANSCLHRAGDPEEGHIRDMITFVIEPSKEPIKEDWIEKIKFQREQVYTQYDPSQEK